MRLKISVLNPFLVLVIVLISMTSLAPAQSNSKDIYSPEDLEDREVTYRDVRLLTMVETDTRFRMPEYTSLEEWEHRADYLYDQILVAAGLMPMPEKTPLNANIFGKTEGEGYTVEKVYFESYPGYFVTGNLYRPTDGPEKHPAIVSPHGHWELGRLTNTDINSIPGRGINLARQGYVVFNYDMVGYNDNRQVGHDFAADTLSNAWGINLLGLQLWNSIRALDFITTLDDVDTTRLGVTGASGGGTQTFLLAAIDDRIKVSVPVNMISTQMQGGCLCENAPGLRVDAFNIELAGLVAPKPMLMVSNTQDWTENTHTVEYPAMRSIYQLYDAENHLKYVQFDFPHNYNRPSREAMYAWFGKWFLGQKDQGQFKEQPFDVPAQEDLLVFLNEPITDRDLTYDEFEFGMHSPPVGELNENKLREYQINQAKELLENHWPGDQESFDKFQKVYGDVYRQVLKAKSPFDVTMKRAGSFSIGDITVNKILISRTGQRDWIPALMFESENGSTTGTVLVSDQGKSAFWDSGRAEPAALVKQLVNNGHAVLAIDPFGIEEHVLQEGTEAQRDEGFTHFTTFNLTDTQERVQDILTSGTFLAGYVKAQKVHLVGQDKAGVWSMLAAGLENRFENIIADANNYNSTDTQDILEYYIPGLARVGGARTSLALSTGSNVVIANSHSDIAKSGLNNFRKLSENNSAITFARNMPSSSRLVNLLKE